MTEELYEKLCRWCPNETRCHEECDVCDEYLMAIETDEEEIAVIKGDYIDTVENEPETAATSPTQSKGENEMNNSLPSDYNTQGGKNQVKKVKLGDCARVYDKAIHNRMTEEGFAITEVPNILYELQELEKRGDISNWVFNKIKEAFYDKWDAMEIEVEDA